MGGLILAVIVVGLVVFAVKGNIGPGKLDNFATCIKNSGATFYGAFWCPHCIATKKLFGNSAKLLPYVECSTPDGNGQTQACTHKKIESYPTWVFADGSRITGEITLDELAIKTACPVDNSTTTPGTVATSTATSTQSRVASSSPIK